MTWTHDLALGIVRPFLALQYWPAWARWPFITQSAPALAPAPGALALWSGPRSRRSGRKDGGRWAPSLSFSGRFRRMGALILLQRSDCNRMWVVLPGRSSGRQRHLHNIRNCVYRTEPINGAPLRPDLRPGPIESRDLFWSTGGARHRPHHVVSVSATAATCASPSRRARKWARAYSGSRASSSSSS